MIATKNGVAVWLEEYQAWVMTDRYNLGDILILRTTALQFHDHKPRPFDLRVHRIEHWFDQHKDFGVMLVRHGDYRRY